MSRSRKLFNSRIQIPGDQAVSLLSVMQTSPLKWTYESDGSTPSMDSILGSEVGLVPDSTIWIGSDANVKNSTVGGFYQGIRVAAALNYSLQDFGGGTGLIDVNQIWLYSVSGTGCDCTFQGR